MKIKRNLILEAIVLLILLLAVIFTTESNAFTISSIGAIKKQSLNIILSKTRLNEGKSTTLLTTRLGINKNEIKWTSEDESIATVDSNGKVTGKEPGKTKITASYSKNEKIKDSCEVTVYEKIIPKINIGAIKKQSLNIILSKTRLNEGKSTTLLTTRLGINKNEIKWTSEDESIATVDSNGKVTGKEPGKTKITASYSKNENENITDSCEVTVCGIVIPKANIELLENDDEYVFKPEVIGYDLKDISYTVKSNNTNVVKVWTGKSGVARFCIGTYNWDRT